MEPRERIRYLRKKLLKMTLEDFSSKINISRSNLGNIETGRINITDRVVSDICQEFEVNEKWLRTGEEPIFIDKSETVKLAEFFGDVMARSDNDALKIIAQAMANLGSEYWERLEQVAHELLDEMQKSTSSQEANEKEAPAQPAKIEPTTQGL